MSSTKACAEPGAQPLRGAVRATQRVGAIVWVTPPEKSTDAAIEGVLAELREHQRGSEPYVLLFDMSSAGILTPLQRKRVAAHMQETRENIRRMVRGLGIIAPSPIVRGVVVALFWVAPPPVPHRIFARRAEAVDWAESVYRSALTPAL
jgi:hypothetical protein